MAEHGEPDTAACERTLSALADGTLVDWDAVEQHLVTCSACAAGLDRFTTAINEQFATTRALNDVGLDPVQAAPASPASPAASDANRLLGFPDRGNVPMPVGRGTTRRLRRLFVGVGAVAAVLALLIGVVTLLPGSSGSRQAAADRRPEFVPSLDVLPSRPDHTYHAGEQVQVCLRINQPGRVHLSVLQGHTTFDLYDADTSPGEHCFPEQVRTVVGRATLRVEVFYGAERVAREDFVLLPAAATP